MFRIADAKTIGERLVKLRGKRTKRVVCEETGLGYSAICMYENGFRIPNDQAKATLAAYYGVSIESLFYTNEYHGE